MSRRQRRAQRERTNREPIRVPGGCPDCNAFQTLDTTRAPIFVLAINHDGTCPTYRSIDRPHQEQA